MNIEENRKIREELGFDSVLHKNTKEDLTHSRITTTDLKYTKGRDDNADAATVVIALNNHHNMEEVKKILNTYADKERLILAPKKSIVPRLAVKKVGTLGKKNLYKPQKQTYKVKTNTFTSEINGSRYSFETLPGLFSYKKIDNGTRHLLQSLTLKNKDVLDLGCGYGAIGISLAEHNEVTMIDSNKHAIEFAKKNAYKNNVDPEIKLSYFLENVQKTFDVIVTNPPTHTSKKEYIPLIKNLQNHVNPRGKVKMVTSTIMNYEKQAKNDYNVDITHEGDYKLLTLQV